ncbi:MAG TPA: efflux RND transporter periplasmic adaptor subunit [Burkholderiaceae bacterium]|nr:efflux RND transporter periplasmic adaptor subunit [Burkholderiaceae bacterium]
MRFAHKLVGAASALAILAVVMGIDGCSGGASKDASQSAKDEAARPAEGKAAGEQSTQTSVDLNDTQVKTIRFAPVGTRSFPRQRVAVGNIDFNEDLAVQVFSPYAGRIIQAFAQLGDEIEKGKALFTIDSPDLVQAESTLIAAAGVYDLTSAALTRAKGLFETQGIAEKDLQQAISDQQSAEGALKAARDAVRVFGKSEAQIDEIVAKRKIDPALVVPCPISGRVTARNAQPGLFVQPGSPPAPYAVADLSTMWMLADVTESDIPMFRLGQSVRVKVLAFPDREFEGKVTNIGATVDPTTRTVLVRSEIRDPKHELRPGMFATYVINVEAPVKGIAVPLAGIVREGDGTMTAWVTTDGHRFTRRIVKVGLQEGGFDQILEGLQVDEQVVTDGAVFLSNMVNSAGTES